MILLMKTVRIICVFVCFEKNAANRAINEKESKNCKFIVVILLLLLLILNKLTNRKK
jgi:hypothetical protein